MAAALPGRRTPGQWLAGLAQEAEQWGESEAALVGAGGALLLGVGAEQGGVDVEDQLLGTGAGIPGALAGLGPGDADPFQ